MRSNRLSSCLHTLKHELNWQALERGGMKYQSIGWHMIRLKMKLDRDPYLNRGELVLADLEFRVSNYVDNIIDNIVGEA